MNISLTHPFIHQAHDISGILHGCRKLSTFMRELEKQSVFLPDQYNHDKYKGDGFEFLVEALIKLSPVNQKIGIFDYQIVKESDTGVDGYGKGVRGQTVTVQVKYRSKTDGLLTANTDHLSNFTTTSLMKYGVDFNPENKKEKNMVIFTTAKDIHHFTKDEMFLGKVRCIGYQDLRRMIDNNLPFWDHLERLVVEYLKEYSEKSKGNHSA